MSRKNPDIGHRVLSVDVRPHRFGYAVFETPARLIDYGATRFDSPAACLHRVSFLMKNSGPSTIVLRKTARSSTRNQPLTRAIIRLIARQSRHSSIQIAFVGERQVRSTLGDERQVTKHVIASLLAQTFPELIWKLPQPRKPWEPESLNMLIFDAVAIGVSHLVSQNDAGMIQKLAGR